MKNLILQKRFTTNYLFVLIGIIFLLSYSKPCVAQKKNTAETYKSYIKQADLALEAADYKKAIEFYEKANQAKPEYNYPTFKINEIKKILETGTDPKTQTSTKTMSSNASYKSMLTKADYEYENKDFGTALFHYDKATKTRPEYSYAYDKMEEINTILNASPETKTKIFENTIHNAENLFEQQNYQQAKSEYEKAALIDTSAQLPKEKLRQISSVYTDPEDMSNFKLAVANGDKALASSDYDHAFMFYEAARQMHPKAKFVNEKITDTKQQQIAYKAKTEQPATPVVSADKVPQTVMPEKVVLPKEITVVSTDKVPQTVMPEKVVLPKEITVVTADKVLQNDIPEKVVLPKEITVMSADKVLQTDIPEKVVLPKEITVAAKVPEPQKQPEQVKYDTTLAAAENALKAGDYETALAGFISASALKPSENYTQLKINEIEKMQAEKTLQKELGANYTAAIANGDKFLSASKYTEALSAYKQALNLKPNETYPAEKTAEINTLLAKQKSDADNYAQAIRTGEKALAAENYSLALTSFINAEKVKPTETYPKQQIIEIKAQIAAQKEKEEKYTKAVNSGDQLFANKQYSGALTAYNEAAKLKKYEKYPQDQIVKINKIISDSRSSDDSYTLAIAEGNKLFGMKEYTDAISAFNKAASLKPSENYPNQRISEILKIVDEMKLAHSAEYNKAIEVADKLYTAKIYDQAIEAYEAAIKINPGDTYSELQISKISKYMSDHAILDLNSQIVTISKGSEKKFTFSAIDPSLRKNNYILIKARSTGNTVPKVYLNYGKDNSKNGGIVLRSIGKYTLSDLLISISGQDKWFREENNWLSISVETGEIEITRVQIAAGE